MYCQVIDHSDQSHKIQGFGAGSGGLVGDASELE